MTDTQSPSLQPLSSLPNAGLLRRLAAMVYDSLLVMTVSMVYGALVLLFQIQILGQALADGEKAHMGPLGFIGLIVVISLFFCMFWRKGGQTLGMRAWRLRIIGKDGDRPSWRACLLRCLLAPLSLAVVGLGYLWCLLDRNGATLHDLLTHSRVVVLPKDKKAKK